jgi:arylsulfatase A-like enzyme
MLDRAVFKLLEAIGSPSPRHLSRDRPAIPATPDAINASYNKLLLSRVGFERGTRMQVILKRVCTRWFIFFFVCIGSIRLWEIFFHPEQFTVWHTFVLICHVICVSCGLTLLELCSRQLALIFLGFLSILYLASEHHLFVQGAYLTARELVNYSVFSPQLMHGYWNNIYWSVMLSGLVVLGVSIASFFWQLPFERDLKIEPKIQERATSGVLTLAFFGIYIHISTGPLAMFVLPIVYAFIPEASEASQSHAPKAFISTSIFPAGQPLAHRKLSVGWEKYNVILIHLESIGDVSSRYRGETLLSSQRRLAATGITWENAYAPAPHTGKSVYSSQTGQYGPAKVSNPITITSRKNTDCIANNFKNAGYRTSYIAANYFHFYGVQRLKDSCDYDVMFDSRQIGKSESDYINGLGTDEAAMFSRAITWATESSEPFFMTLQTVLPHWPYIAPPSWSSPAVSKNDRLQQYRNSLSYVDGSLNRFIDQLEQRGLRERSIIVLFGDHGEAFSEHPNNLIHGAELYEENVRIPFVISNPKLIPTASTSRSLASLVDIGPTLFDMMGMSWNSSRVDGISLFAAPANRMVFMVSDLVGDKYGVRDGEYKFIYLPPGPRSLLFNLKDDPQERKNLTKQLPERTAFYTNAIQSWIDYSQQRDPNRR